MNRMTILLSGRSAYCHLAPIRLEIGQEIGPAPDAYFQRFGQIGFFQVLERFRPAHLLPHRCAVVMHASLDALDNAEAGEWLHEIDVPADAAVQRHDVSWANHIALLTAGEPEPSTARRIREAAQHYWQGTPSDDPVWEYLTAKAFVAAAHPVK